MGDRVQSRDWGVSAKLTPRAFSVAQGHANSTGLPSIWCLGAECFRETLMSASLPYLW